MNENRSHFPDVMALEQARRRAMIAADVATLERLLGDDLQWIHASGRPESKAAFLASIESRKIEFESIECSEETARAYGATVLLSGVADIRAKIAGESRALKNRFTIVWVQTGAQWEAVNWQSTGLPN